MSGTGLGRLLGRLRVDRHSYEPSLMEFPQLDANKLTVDLRLKERAAENGKANLPRTTAMPLDDVEQEIIRIYDHNRNKGYETFSNNVSVYAARLERLRADTLVAGISATCDGAIADFKTDAQIDSSKLYAARKDVVNIEEDYEAFRKKHQIKRSGRERSRRIRPLFPCC